MLGVFVYTAISAEHIETLVILNNKTIKRIIKDFLTIEYSPVLNFLVNLLAFYSQGTISNTFGLYL